MNISRLTVIILIGLSVSACGGAEDRKAEYFSKAEKSYAAGDFEKARVEYQNVLQIDPRDTTARYQLGMVLEQLQDFRGAAGQYNAILEQDDTHIKARVRLGQFYLLAQRSEQAMEEAEKALSIAPDDADVLAFRGSIYLRRNDNEPAMRDTMRALEIDPDNVNAILLKTTILNRNGNVDEAITGLTAAIAKKPDNVLLRNSLAGIYTEAGEPDKAMEQIRALITQQPDVLFHRLRLADIQIANQDPAQAEATIRQAIADFPENDQVKISLIRYLATSEDSEAAIRELQKFINEQPDNNSLKFYLAQLYQGQGQSGLAMEIFREVIAEEELKPDGLSARTRLAELTAFDVETGQKGILVGDSAALRLDVDFSNLLSGVFSGAGTIRSLETVGISIESDGTLTFDENRFQERFAEDSDSVREFFITEEFGFADRTTALVDQLAAADNSLLLNRIESLAAKVTANNSRIEFLNEQLEGERERLLNDFIRMEQAIAEIQNALSSISTLAPLPILF